MRNVKYSLHWPNGYLFYQEILLMPEASQYSTPKEEGVAVEMSCASLTWETEDENDCGEIYLLPLYRVTETQNSPTPY